MIPYEVNLWFIMRFKFLVPVHLHIFPSKLSSISCCVRLSFCSNKLNVRKITLTIIILYLEVVSHCQTQPTTKKGSGQSTILVFIKSLARFLVYDKPLIIFIIQITIFITILSSCMNTLLQSITSLPGTWHSWRKLV